MQKRFNNRICVNSPFQRIPVCRGPQNAGYVKTEEHSFLAETVIAEVKLNIHQSRCKENDENDEETIILIRVPRGSQNFNSNYIFLNNDLIQ